MSSKDVVTDEQSLLFGDCLERMKEIPDGSVDLILTDPPYGTTACKWDSVIPFEPMWAELKRIIKPNGAIVLFGSQPFTSRLICSNIEMFKYQLVWKKTKVSHFAQAPYRFLTEHEDIVVFSFGGTSKNSKNRMAYNPQGLIATRYAEVRRTQTIDQAQKGKRTIFRQKQGIQSLFQILRATQLDSTPPKNPLPYLNT